MPSVLLAIFSIPTWPLKVFGFFVDAVERCERMDDIEGRCSCSAEDRRWTTKSSAIVGGAGGCWALIVAPKVGFYLFDFVIGMVNVCLSWRSKAESHTLHGRLGIQRKVRTKAEVRDVTEVMTEGRCRVCWKKGSSLPRLRNVVVVREVEWSKFRSYPVYLVKRLSLPKHPRPKNSSAYRYRRLRWKQHSDPILHWDRRDLGGRQQAVCVACFGAQISRLCKSGSLLNTKDRVLCQCGFWSQGTTVSMAWVVVYCQLPRDHVRLIAFELSHRGNVGWNVPGTHWHIWNYGQDSILHLYPVFPGAA